MTNDAPQATPAVPVPRSGTWTARNNMQRGPSREEHPALPGLLALINHHREKSRSDFSQ